MRGRRPQGPEYADKLQGSETAKLRAKVILETMAGTLRLQEACAILGVSEQRFHQLREEMMTAAVNALEPGQAGRPAQVSTPEKEQVLELKQQLAEKNIELRAAQARAEIAIIMPKVERPSAGPLEPEKKMPVSRKERRRRGRKKNT